MKTYILTISDGFGCQRRTTVKAHSRHEAIDKVTVNDSEYVSFCREMD